MTNPFTFAFWESAEHLFFAVVTLWLLGLTWKLWQYRQAIKGLQKDTSEMYEHVTQPGRQVKRNSRVISTDQKRGVCF